MQWDCSGGFAYRHGIISAKTILAAGSSTRSAALCLTYAKLFGAGPAHKGSRFRFGIVRHSDSLKWLTGAGGAVPLPRNASRLQQTDLDQPFAQIIVCENSLGIAIRIFSGDATRQCGDRKIGAQMQEERHGIPAIP